MQILLQPEQSLAARELLNLSQAKVAKDSGINRAYLSQFENGKRILNDAENDALYEYYDAQGLSVEGLGRVTPIKTTTGQSGKPMVNMEHFTPVYSVSPSRIKDGIVVSRELDSDTVETLMAEYYDLEKTIVKQLEQPVSRLWLFNDIDNSETIDKALPLLLACYRQRQIKESLQGRMSIARPKPIKENDIKTLEDYLQAKQIA